MTRMTKTVRKIDIGSLRPDSISSSAVIRSGRARRARPSSAATAAASVGATAEPTSMAIANGTAAIHMTAAATMAAVMPTPTPPGRALARPPGAASREGLQAAFEQDDRERHAADQVGRGEVVVGDAARAVLAGQHAKHQEDQQHRRAEATGEEAGECARHTERRTDEDHLVSSPIWAWPRVSMSGPMVIPMRMFPGRDGQGNGGDGIDSGSHAL